MSMNKFNDLNEWEDDYYSRKHSSRTVTAGYLVWLIGGIAILAALSLLMSCNRTTYSPEVLQGYQPIRNEKIACDTLIDRATGERIPVYNCETTW
jgi:hypothetical protein